jgi:fused signal recognition particle receptor
MEFVLIAIAIVVVALIVGLSLLVGRGRRTTRLDEDAASGTTLTRPRPPAGASASGPGAPPAPPAEVADQVQPDTVQPEAAPDVDLPPVQPEPGLTFETPPPSAGPLVRLRSRLARSQSSLGRGLLTVLARERLTEEDWEEVEETLLAADVGVAATTQIVERLRTQSMVMATASGQELRDLLVRELTAVLGPDLDRTLGTDRHGGLPGVVLVVGVNGAGKTTTVGKIARALVGDGKSVVLGAADTFRAAAADQLETWGERVGVLTVRGREGGDPASVAFEAVRTGMEGEVDTVVVDTAGRLHTKSGLMDELGKVKRVVEKQAPVTETLLVLDATTGQNGVIQARVFTEAVAVTGVVLTKLDGTAKGGIVVSVQRELGIPVKLVGLGEGPDDLAPFEPEAFAEAIVG